MNYLRPELLDRLAAAFALGTLSRAATRRFVLLQQQAPQARRAVEAWQERLNQLAKAVAPIEPTEAVWQNIRRRTFGAGQATPRRAAWWMPALGTALGALAVVGVARLEPRWLGVVPASTVALAPAYVGLLTTPAGEPAVVASSLKHGRVLSLKLLRPVTPPAGQVAQLWALPTDGPPFALGLLPTTAKGTLTLADSSDRLFAKVTQLAVSYELAPAQAGARPNAPFVLSGHCVKMW